MSAIIIIVVHIDCRFHVKALVSNITSLEPYVVLTVEDLAYLVIDKQIVDQVTSVQDIPLLLMSAFLFLIYVTLKVVIISIPFWKSLS